MEKKTVKKAASTAKSSANGNGKAQPSPRLSVLKTYKIYIDGAFPRTESGRFYPLHGPGGSLLANVCLGSRKDFRNAVAAARKAQTGWAGRAAMNRGQILYRIAEMLEGRRAQFVEEMVGMGSTPESADREVSAAVDCCLYYAGWCDKYQQVFGSVNPVASSHFNFSVPEPTGVVSVIAPENSALLGLVQVILPMIAGGNTVVSLASESRPLCAVTFAEVLHSSDVPAGVVNLITGQRKELLPQFAQHMDVNATLYAGPADENLKRIQEYAVQNVKRVIHRADSDWYAEAAQGPYFILDAQETKTTWHPVGI